MSEKPPPFDPLKAAFWLIAFVIFVEAAVVMMGVTSCLFYADVILHNPEIKCDPDNRLFQLLTGALAAAIALYAKAKGDDTK